MANQYTLTNDFAEIAEEKGTLYNKGDSAIELASTADTAKGAGILLLTGERRTFSGTLYARSMDAAGLLNVADFKDGGEGGEDNLSGVPLGTILPYSANTQTPPYSFLFCEGQAVSRTMYPDLFALIGTTYGAGNGSTTFNLPNMLGKYPQGDTTSGTVKSAGLPNIEGSTLAQYMVVGGTADTANNNIIQNTTGAMTASYAGATTNNILSGSTTGVGAQKITFNASRSNPIYGASDTVLPPTLTVRWIIKAYDAPTPSSAQVDLSQYASDLAARLTREQTPAFNRRDVITVSGTYTAPVTGWYRIVVKGGGGGGNGGAAPILVSGVLFSRNGHGGGEGGTSIGYARMTAGQTASVVVGAGGSGGAGAASYSGSLGTGTNGGNSSVTVNGNTYTGGGGVGGGNGGSGDIVGANGNYPTFQASNNTFNSYPATEVGSGYGKGGYGGGVSGGTGQNGGNGGNGFVWFEYFDGSLN